MINSKVFRIREEKYEKVGNLQDFSLGIPADNLFLSDDSVDHVFPYCPAEPSHLEWFLGFCLHKPEVPKKIIDRS